MTDKDIMARSESEWRTYIANNQRTLKNAIDKLIVQIEEVEKSRCKECGVTDQIAAIAQSTSVSLAKGEVRMDEQDKAIAHNTVLTHEAVANSKQIIDILTAARVGANFIKWLGVIGAGLAGLLALFGIKWMGH